MQYFIFDWAGNDLTDSHNGPWKTFDDAEEALTEWIETNYPEAAMDERVFNSERGEFYILTKKELGV